MSISQLVISAWSLWCTRSCSSDMQTLSAWAGPPGQFGA